MEEEKEPRAFFIDDVDEFVGKHPDLSTRVFEGKASEEELRSLEASGELRRIRTDDLEASVREQMDAARERRTDEIIRRRVG